MADQDDEIIDQNDIDKLLEASSPDSDEDADSNDDVSELSQDDIDALMNGPIIDTPSTEEDEEDFELDLISQDDINQLVLKKNEQTADAPEISEIAAGEESSLPDTPDVSLEPEVQEELPLQEEPAVQEEPLTQEEPETIEKPIALENDVIDESESVGIEECLVTQENIDQLIEEDKENSAFEDELTSGEQIVEQEVEPVIQEAEQFEEEPLAEESIIQEELVSQEEPIAQEEPALQEDVISGQENVPEEEVTTEQEVAMEEEKKEEEGIEEEPASEAIVVDLNEDDDLKEELDNIENEELQGDIDGLLDDSDDDSDDDWEQDSLISQDDIEDLIKSSENEDEDALGDLDSSDDAGNHSEDASMEEDDEGEDEEYEEYEEEDSQVILEESEDQAKEGKSKEKSKKKKKKKKRGPIKIRKKFIMIAASVIFFIGISLVAGFFFLKGDKKGTPTQKMTAQTVIPEEPVVESVEINIDQESSKPVVSRPVPQDLLKEPLVMKEFLILAPETIESLVYIEADISIDYSTDNAYYEIKQNMPFYRDVIYSAIQKALGSSKGDKITESDLLMIVKKALIKALPEGSINKVGFNSFKAG
jgi:pilus assembly protein FimV